MAQALNVNLKTSQLWPQGDMRDPLGVWGAFQGVTGDVTGGEIKVGITVPQAERAAYIYTCYSALIAVLQAPAGVQLGAVCRLLTNWPDVDPTAGVQGYGSAILRTIAISTAMTAPIGAPAEPFITGADRFILLFDPRPQPAGDLTIVELKCANQVNTDLYTFEAYGYYWDRSVLNAPGGPRHPGAS